MLENSEEKFLGSPMIDESQKGVNLDPGAKKDYTFNFKIGVLPEFEIKGLAESFPDYGVEIDEKTIDENLDQLGNQEGTRVAFEVDLEWVELITLYVVDLR